MKLSELAKIINASHEGGDVAFGNFSIDTRTLNSGEIYFAIVGHSLDGHDYIAQAKEKGAVAAVVSKHVDIDIPQLQVTDTTQALGAYAHFLRKQYDLPIVAITGSVGKTTTRNMLAAICKVAFGEEKVLVPKKNFNNQWGLPLTLKQLNSQHHCAVLEMGMDHLGEIAALARMAEPTIVVITCASGMHLELLGSIENIAKAKGEIIEESPDAAQVVLNKDDRFFSYWQGLVGARKLLTFSGQEQASVTGKVLGAQSFAVMTPEGDFDVTLNLLGKHNLGNVLAATTAAIALGVPIAAIKAGLESVQAQAGRMLLKKAFNGANVIDDTYNAPPEAMRAALNVLAQFPGKRIFVMGDMKELGPDEVNIHAKMAEAINSAQVDLLLTYGELAKHATQGCVGKSKHFEDQEALSAYLKEHLTEQTTVLVKGSRAMRMENIVTRLL